MKKQASIAALAGTLIAGEAAMKGLQRLGTSRDVNLFSAGVDLAGKGNRMNPIKEKMVRNVLGNKQIAPYEAGKAVGNRMIGMEPERANRFLHKTVGMGTARKQRLEDTGAKTDPVLRAMERYQTGDDHHNKLTNSFLTSLSRKGNTSSPLENIASNVATAPGALLDWRVAGRPVMRTVEKTAPFQKAKNRFIDVDAKRSKVYDGVRDYID